MKPIKPAHLAALSELLEEVGGTPFRRSQLAERIFPLLRPRDHTVASARADEVIQEAARQGLIVRSGHQHWAKVSKGSVQPRTGGDRRPVGRGSDVKLQIITRHPGQYAAVDMRDGVVWLGNPDGTWQMAGASELKKIAATVAKALARIDPVAPGKGSA